MAEAPFEVRDDLFQTAGFGSGERELGTAAAAMKVPGLEDPRSRVAGRVAAERAGEEGFEPVVLAELEAYPLAVHLQEESRHRD